MCPCFQVLQIGQQKQEASVTSHSSRFRIHQHGIVQNQLPTDFSQVAKNWSTCLVVMLLESEDAACPPLAKVAVDLVKEGQDYSAILVLPSDAVVILVGHLAMETKLSFRICRIQDQKSGEYLQVMLVCRDAQSLPGEASMTSRMVASTLWQKCLAETPIVFEVVKSDVNRPLWNKALPTTFWKCLLSEAGLGALQDWDWLGLGRKVTVLPRLVFHSSSQSFCCHGNFSTGCQCA